MKFNLRDIKISYVDKREGLILPQGPSEKLAEFIGILAGDGYVNYSGNPDDYLVEITGHARDDLKYIHYVKNLIYFLFHLEAHLRLPNKGNAIYLNRKSKGLISFLKATGYAKYHSLINVPNWIWSRELFTKYFIRGLFDTDGTIALKKNHGIGLYPVIAIGLKDEFLVRKVASWINSRGINAYVGFSTTKLNGKSFKLLKFQISGRKNLQKWIRLIGMNNSKHIKKIKKVGSVGLSENS